MFFARKAVGIAKNRSRLQIKVFLAKRSLFRMTVSSASLRLCFPSEYEWYSPAFFREAPASGDILYPRLSHLETGFLSGGLRKDGLRPRVK